MKKLLILMIAIIVVLSFSVSYAVRSIKKGESGENSSSSEDETIAVRRPVGTTVTRPATQPVATRPSSDNIYYEPSSSDVIRTISKIDFTIPELKDDGAQIKAEDISITQGASITAMSWTNVTKKTFMSANEKYRKDNKYSVRIYFKEVEGYTISNVAVFVNEEKIGTVSKLDDGRYMFDKEFEIATETEPQTGALKEISKVDVVIPEVSAGNSMIVDEDMKITKGVRLDGYSWSNESTKLFMQSDEKYEEGNKYTLKIYLVPDIGYAFKDLKATLNGEEMALVTVEKDKQYMFEKTYEVKKESSSELDEKNTMNETNSSTEINESNQDGEVKIPVLTNIDITVAEPEVGKALPTTYKVISNLVKEATEYKVGEKKEDNLATWDSSDKEVKADEEYTFKLDIELKNSMAQISEDLKITINKKEVKPKIKDGIYTVEYIFETDKAEAKSTQYNLFAFEITPPKVGDTPDKNAKAMSKDYKVTKVDWLTSDEKFVAGETYTVDIYFEMINKDVRSDYYATVNGIGAELPNGDANYAKNTMYAEFTFPTLRDTSKKAAWSNASNWALDELSEAVNAGLIPDVLDKQDLKMNVTRKEFAHIAVKLYEMISGKGIRVTSAPFKDTDDIEIAKAYTVGITNGISETEFAPDQEISREQMATMMARALEKAGVDTFVDLTKIKEFTDDSEMHNWSRSAIYFMSNIEIIKGMGENRFGVKENASREQSIIIAIRSAAKFASKK